MDKLYCYVDESGQHTEGEYFLVSVVIIPNAYKDVEELLLTIEKQSGKRHLKWSKTKNEYRLSYIKLILEYEIFQNCLYAVYFESSQDYVGMTISGTAKAIQHYTEDNDDYKATIFVDGLRKSEIKRFGAGLRKEGVRTEKVRGRDDAKDPIIRLADAICGWVSYAKQGRKDFKDLFDQAQKNDMLILL